MGGAHMNPEREGELEKEISKALQGLPDLAAPPGFLARTMSALEQPAPQRVRTWSDWPMSVKAAFFFMALAAVAAVVMGWSALEPGLFAATYRSLAPAVASLKC